MNNNNNNNNTTTTGGYRAIVPAPSPQQSIINPMIPISPHQSPQTRPNPHHGISLPPPFGTPPVSPFSHPMNTNNPDYLPPPLQPLPPMMSLNGTPPSPTSGRYERILPKQKAPTTSVFSIPMTPSNANSVMHHHNSVIHPYHHRASLSGASTGNDKQQLSTADQRELARKVSHSAIERRRRERINDKIMQLKDLIPSCADQDHLHKLSILQSAIEYIQYLQGCVVESRKRGIDNADEQRTTKKSKFDRYEIPIPKNLHNDKSSDENINSNNNNNNNNNDNNITSTKSKKEMADASTNTDTNIESEKDVNREECEEADALLLLSKSSSTTNSSTTITNETDNTDTDDSLEKKIPETRDVEIQTSPSVSETTEDDEEKEEAGDEEEEVEEEPIPRRGMTVQQLLCN